MRILLLLVGLFIGAAVGEQSASAIGTLFGGLLGWLVGEVILLRQRAQRLEAKLEKLSLTRETSSTPSPQVHREVTPRAATSVASMPLATLATASSSTPSVSPSPYQRQPRAEDRPVEQRHRETSAPPTGVERFLQNVFKLVRDYFTGGNTVVRVSIIVLFFGVAFLLQYAAEHSHLPIELRLSGVTLGAIALLIVGWRLRHKRLGYAVALQGGAVGILYLVIFAALRIYSLMPATLAFALLILVVLLSGVLAVLQNSMSLAVLGISGGFLAPILTSTGQGSHVVLFSYYAVLNVGILGIAWMKAWRPLNVLGFAFTFVIGIAWGVTRYSPELFNSTEPFLILFFVFYVAIAILFAARQPPELKGYVDGTLIFGTPIIAFGLQAAMLHDRRYALAFSALIVSALYLSIASVLWRRRASWRLLVEAFLALSVVFLTLALPLALNGRWSAVSWAIEGAALIWIGCRQSRVLPRISGVLLQLAAALMFARDLDSWSIWANGLPILNSACLGGIIVAIAAVISSALLQKYSARLRSTERWLSSLLFFWGLLWWLLAGTHEIHRRLATQFILHADLALLAVTAVLCSEIHGRLKIARACWPALWLLPAMLLFVAADWIAVSHSAAYYGWLAWPVAFIALYLIAHRHESILSSVSRHALHAIAAWMLVSLLARECYWLIDHVVAASGSWPMIAWALLPASALLLLPVAQRQLHWPVGAHPFSYRIVAGGGFALYLALWSLVSSLTKNGDPHPLPYVPLLNPLDLAQIYALMAVLAWGVQSAREQYKNDFYLTPQMLWGSFGVLVFFWLNAVLLRTLHYWMQIPYAFDVMWRTTLVQASLSIFWTVLALLTMFSAARYRQRAVWFVGASLMGVVLLKLVFVDLSKVGSVARIVSFIGVGLLMLIIGYFSPTPPKREATP